MKTKLLYLAQNTIEGNIIKAELSERNIPCYLSGSNLQVGIGELPVDAMFSKVYVNEEDFEAAKVYIEEYKANLEIDKSGTWTCSFCKEKSPNYITSCWNYSEEKDLQLNQYHLLYFRNITTINSYKVSSQ